MIAKLEALHTDTSITEKKERWVTVKEAHLLLQLAVVHKPGTILESGTANGISASWLAQSGYPVITFDPVNRNKMWDALGITNITYIEDSFSSVVTRYPALQGRKKMFFIDGDHTRGGVENDCRVVEQMASPGDLIVIHDLNEEKVMRGFRRLQKHASSSQIHDTERIMGSLVWA